MAQGDKMDLSHKGRLLRQFIIIAKNDSLQAAYECLAHNIEIEFSSKEEETKFIYNMTKEIMETNFR